MPPHRRGRIFHVETCVLGDATIKLKSSWNSLVPTVAARWPQREASTPKTYFVLCVELLRS
ncbi:hypothetical protein PILCRDRAFT_820413 [Piloderma croceum F 1598]|uniref:Uncharacterized protein n=1 Tax=Piloderma croceum (strain F 1598) TaxID=765440 RepID=A0A0C3FUI4_PILCF|nr:hypothetical protein PILCRDRAFT_820413 [Piloderma croceum F 1598]